MKIILIISIFLSHGMLQGQTMEHRIRQEQFNVEDNLAIEGYDPVAYQTVHKALVGKDNLSYTHEGVTYHFVTLDNKELFIKNPSKFEPAYGGWCAYAMGATGEKVSIDPETFKIIDDKLYLFYNRFFINTLNNWNKDQEDLKTQADKNWNTYKP